MTETDSYDVICIGETMGQLSPASAVPLVEQPPLLPRIGGAESNVACGLAGLGHRVAWMSRVGDDPFGAIITRTLARYGVDTSLVEVDQERPTGLYLKDPAPKGTRVYYYRRESAASAIGPRLAERPELRTARLLHLSGITPALSTSCAAFVQRLFVSRPAHGPLLSFDVNYRPALWPADDAAPVLLDLARAADLVFVGRDEAEQLWQASTADQVRALLPDVPLLVVKDADVGATSYTGARRVFVPAPRVDVVEAVGAGDAFAAGFLSGLLDDRTPEECLRLGHIMAAATLLSVADLAPFPPREARERLLALSPAAWAALCIPDPDLFPLDPSDPLFSGA
ncbi:sugar kinase [Thermobifida fusca]|uniref:Putative PfkB-family carbohydrate kinase n=3 Tax=Thermobifida fusca TaxID=2021 RepID=Q47TI7_THEFY|nr:MULTISPECIES: sugar kinase [Thermobifida]AAZ54227.1 putative PfkB-family carbohydrate kinase [Thermobifida fusca YX]MBO2528680.1 sugar kinase [Thermobifida sp.]MDD6790910.1 sugar kinase [Thermobifida fusca]PPS92018.1 carbohydrate kinase [Thermobifida fusca]PZN63787.1 MAG: sugar kinase [Thermobifida fusca]